MRRSRWSAIALLIAAVPCPFEDVSAQRPLPEAPDSLAAEFQTAIRVAAWEAAARRMHPEALERIRQRIDLGGDHELRKRVQGPRHLRARRSRRSQPDAQKPPHEEPLAADLARITGETQLAPQPHPPADPTVEQEVDGVPGHRAAVRGEVGGVGIPVLEEEAPPEFLAELSAEALARGLLERSAEGVWRPTALGMRFLDDLQAEFLPSA